MFSLLRQNVSSATLFQLGAELSWLFAAIMLVLRLDGEQGIAQSEAALLAFLFALTIVCLNGAFGLYRRTQKLSTGAYFLRIVLAPAIGIPLAFLVAHWMPGIDVLRDNWITAIVLALLGLLLVRHVIVLPLVSHLMPHRVLVLGTGPEARVVEASLTSTNPLGVRLVGFYPLEKAQENVVSPDRVMARGAIARGDGRATRHRRNHRRRAPAARWRAAAARAARMPPERRAGDRPRRAISSACTGRSRSSRSRSAG